MDQSRGAEIKGLSPVHLAVNEEESCRWGNRSNFNSLETMMQNRMHFFYLAYPILVV